jgi:hypothetical protein
MMPAVAAAGTGIAGSVRAATGLAGSVRAATGLAGSVRAATGLAVTVRVEGLKRTLLPPTVIHTHSGWITKYGAPTGKCPADSAQGALDVATHHDWGGSWDTSLTEYEILSILGETHSFSSKYYWEIFVDNVSASAGACDLKLHPGEQLMFAAVPDSPTTYPIALQAPTSATAGHAFTAKVVYFNGSGKAKPLSGATVSVAGHSGRTNSHGTVRLTPSHAGTFVLHAEHAGYVRAAPVTLHVS